MFRLYGHFLTSLGGYSTYHYNSSNGINSWETWYERVRSANRPLAINCYFYITSFESEGYKAAQDATRGQMEEKGQKNVKFELCTSWWVFQTIIDMDHNGLCSSQNFFSLLPSDTRPLKPNCTQENMWKFLTLFVTLILEMLCVLFSLKKHWSWGFDWLFNKRKKFQKGFHESCL